MSYSPESNSKDSGSTAQILADQHDYFSEHPFPGLPFDGVGVSEFMFTLEKNELYRAIAALVRPGFRVFDAACGTGEFTSYLALATEGEVLGFDYSQKTIDWAENLRSQLGSPDNLSFHHKDIFSLQESDFGLADVVLAMGLWTSIPSEQQAMKKLVHVLKPGGIAVFGFFDPVGRTFMCMKRGITQAAATSFEDRVSLVDATLLFDIDNPNERKWHINQLNENVLNYHTPSEGVAMMNACSLTVTDSFPQMGVLGSTIQKSINIQTPYRLPASTWIGRLRSGADGYFVLIGITEKGLS